MNKLRSVKLLTGFTLIELVVSVAIIVLMTSLVVSAVQNARIKARDGRRQADLKQIQIALATFFDVNHAYPNDLFNNGLAGTYLNPVPTDPRTTLASAVQYDYRVDGVSGLYCLGAIMEGTPPPDSASCDTGNASDNFKVAP